MTIAEYAKEKGVSKQSVYDRIRRGTLGYEIIDGVKHVIDAPAKVVPVENVDTANDKRLNKALEKLLRCKQRVKLLRAELKGMETLLLAKDSEIDTLKRTFGLMTIAIEGKLLPTVSDTIEVENVSQKKKKKKKKKKK